MSTLGFSTPELAAPVDGPSPRWRAAAAAIVLAAALIVSLQYGFDGMLARDDAIYMYSGQRMADGIPPYVSTFDHKGPLTPMLTGFGVMLARGLQADELFVVRVIFLGFSLATVLAIHLHATHLFRSLTAGLFAAAFFISFAGFMKYAAAGPQAKTPMLMFQALCLLFASRRRWFLAGAAGSLSFLVWQPMAVYAAGAFVLALAGPPGRRIRNALACAAGALLPIAAVTAYFMAHGALYALIDGAILFNLKYLDSSYVDWRDRITLPYQAAEAGFGAVAGLIAIGLLMFVIGYTLRRRAYPDWRSWVQQDPFMPLLLTFPAPVAWTLIDFQWFADLYPFLPYAAIGLAWLTQLTLDGMKQAVGPGSGRGVIAVSAAGLCLLLGCLSAVKLRVMRMAETSLPAQRAAIEEINRSFGADALMVSLGAPEVLVLRKVVNPNPYVFVLRGVDARIQDLTPGGIQGFLRTIDAQRPAYIVVGPLTGQYLKEFYAWIASDRFRNESFGPFVLLVPQRRM